MYGIGFVLFVFFVIFLLSWAVVYVQEAAFNKKFPSLTDEEFIAKLDPGIDPQIALKVRRVLSDSLGIDYERIHPNASLVKDLACD